MEKEIIELVISCAGDKTTLVGWYLALNFISNIINWCGVALCIYWLVRGARHAGEIIKGNA